MKNEENVYETHQGAYYNQTVSQQTIFLSFETERKKLKLIFPGVL